MHKSVLVNECIENLNIKDDSIIVDCTLGYGGHCSEWQWKYDNLQKLSIEDLVLLYNTINQENYKEKLYYAKDKSKVKVDFTMLDVRKDE